MALQEQVLALKEQKSDMAKAIEVLTTPGHQSGTKFN